MHDVIDHIVTKNEINHTKNWPLFMDCSLEGCLLVALWTDCFDLCDGGLCFESDLMEGALWIESIF